MGSEMYPDNEKNWKAFVDAVEQIACNLYMLISWRAH